MRRIFKEECNNLFLLFNLSIFSNYSLLFKLLLLLLLQYNNSKLLYNIYIHKIAIRPPKSYLTWHKMTRHAYINVVIM